MPGSAEAFRDRLRQSDDLAAKAIRRLIAPLKARFAKNPYTPGYPLLACARQTWINDVPTFGCVSGPHPNLKRDRLSISETRCGSAAFKMPDWFQPDDEDALPAIAVFRSDLIAQPGLLYLQTSLLLLVELSQVQRWFECNDGADDDDLMETLKDLALIHVNGSGKPYMAELCDDEQWELVEIEECRHDADAEIAASQG